jgi:hypothetical protein
MLDAVKKERFTGSKYARSRICMHNQFDWIWETQESIIDVCQQINIISCHRLLKWLTERYLKSTCFLHCLCVFHYKKWHLCVIWLLTCFPHCRLDCIILNGASFFPWRYTHIFGLGLPPWNCPFHFGFLDLKTAGRTPWAGDELVTRPLSVHKHRKTHTC